MKAFVKNYVLLAIVVLFGMPVSGQNKNIIYLSGGAGGSNISGSLFFYYHGTTAYTEYTWPSPYSVTPVYNFTADFRAPSRHFSFGLGLAYQNTFDEVGGSGWSYNCHVSRTNCTIRTSWTMFNPKKDSGKVRDFEAFYGIRFGLSFWTQTDISGLSSPQAAYTTYSPMVSISLQLYFSFRLFVFCQSSSPFFKRLGIQAEVGLGAPYYAEGGLIYRVAD